MRTFPFKKARIPVPGLVAVIVFLSGILNVYSAFYSLHPRRFDVLNYFLPLSVSHHSRTLILLFGFSLLFLSWGLSKGKYRAWWISVVLISLSLLLHLTKGLDFEEAIALLIPLALLLIFKAQFSVRSATRRLTKRMALAAAVFIMLFLYSTVGFFLLQGQFTKPVTWSNVYRDYEYSVIGTGQDTLIPVTHRARWFEDSIAITGFAAILFIMAALFEPYIFPKEVDEKSLNLIRELTLRSRNHPVSYYSLMPDKQYYISADQKSFIAYKAVTGSAIALGDPIGPEQDLPELAKSFRDQMRQNGLTPAFYLTTAEYSQLYKDLGFKLLKIGEDAVIQVPDFDLSRPNLKNIRNSLNHVKRKGISFAWYNMQDVPWHSLNQVQKLHDTWLNERKSSPMSFSMDFFPFPPEPTGWLLLAFDDKRSILGGFSFFPYNCGKSMLLDLMLKADAAPSGLIDAALAEAVDWAKKQEKQEVNLGLATVSFSQQKDANASPIAQKAVDFLYNNVNIFYNYRSLAAYKAKFHPQWQPRFLAYPSEAELPKVALALAQAQMPHALLSKLSKL